MSALKGRTKNFGFGLINFDWPRWSSYEWDNWKALDAALGLALSNFSVKGIWEVNTGYIIGDRIIDTDTADVWECLVTHTSAGTGTFGDDRAAHPTYWKRLGSVPNFRGAWVSGVAYNNGDIVKVNYAYFLCVTPHTSDNTTNTTANASLWTTIFDATAVMTDATAAKDAAVAAQNDIGPKYTEIVAKYNQINIWNTNVDTKSADVTTKHGQISTWYTDISNWHTDVQTWRNDTWNYREQARVYSEAAATFDPVLYSKVDLSNSTGPRSKTAPQFAGDVNILKEVGHWYCPSTCTNLPSAHDYLISVVHTPHTTGAIATIQYAQNLSTMDSSHTSKYKRYKYGNNSTWSAWFPIVDHKEELDFLYVPRLGTKRILAVGSSADGTDFTTTSTTDVHLSAGITITPTTPTSRIILNTTIFISLTKTGTANDDQRANLALRYFDGAAYVSFGGFLYGVINPGTVLTSKVLYDLYSFPVYNLGPEHHRSDNGTWFIRLAGSVDFAETSLLSSAIYHHWIEYEP